MSTIGIIALALAVITGMGYGLFVIVKEIRNGLPDYRAFGIPVYSDGVEPPAKEDFMKAIDIFITESENMNIWSERQIKKAFDDFPIVFVYQAHTRDGQDKAGLAYARRLEISFRRDLYPNLGHTALFHEMIHRMLEFTTGDADIDHSLGENSIWDYRHDALDQACMQSFKAYKQGTVK